MELQQAYKRCSDCLVWAIEHLGGKVDLTRIEHSAELISQTMTGPWRYFHTPEHIFEVGGAVNGRVPDPIEVLAALYHDLVYVQVDQGMNLNISSYITPFVKEVRGQIAIRDAAEMPQSLMFEIVKVIFGFVEGQTLSPFAGQNEFLSAAIAALALEPLLSPSIIAKITACIEATIPFRAKSPSGLSASELLYQRLIGANSQFNFGWSDVEIQEIVQKTVRMANRDVENFACLNSADFLDNTWNLMPETNHELSQVNSYTVAGYRKSLQKMEGFLNFLQPDRVFQQFMGYPDDETFQKLIVRTKKNLEVSKLYLASKLITIAILEALSIRLGKDIPLSTMMGELPTPGFATPALEHFLPDVEMAYPPETELEREVLELLSKGRKRDSHYDIKNSPVATFIIKSIGFGSVGYLKELAKEFFAGNISAADFLSKCDPQVVKTVIDGVEQLFDSRKLAWRGT